MNMYLLIAAQLSPIVLFALAVTQVFAAPEPIAWPPDNMPKPIVKHAYQPVFRFGYAPDRLLPEDVGWIAHVGSMHSTEFEEHPDFVRVNVGYGSGFMRSYLGGLDDYPGVGKPGRIVMRARRDHSNTIQHIKMMVVSNERHWEWRIEKDIIFDWFRKDDKEAKDNKIAWPNDKWDSWHDYVITFTGDSASVSIDNDPALTMPLKIDRGEGKMGSFYVSIGGTMDWLDVQSIRFIGMDEPVIVPEPQSKISDGIFTSKYANGRTCVETVFAGGVENGPFICWWPDGTKRCEGKYEKGIKQGLWIYWYPSGQKSWERTFKDDALDGKVIHWSFDGKRGYTFEYKSGRRVKSTEWIGAPDTHTYQAKEK